MDYNGTENDDIIDGNALKLPDWSNIFGKGGNDRITLGTGRMIGGAGNDTLVGTTAAYSTVAYWGSPAAIRVNLQTGIVQDGWGGTDTLINIHSIQGTPFDDQFIGSSGNDAFFGGGGNDSFVGGGGYDKIMYYSEKSTAASISYDIATDTFTVRKNFSNGDKGVDTITGFSAISFEGSGSDGKVISKANFVTQGGFLRQIDTTAVSFPSNAGLTQFKTGDFNGDGKTDLLLVTQVGQGSSLAPSYVLLNDGTGHFTDDTANVFVDQPYAIIGGGRTAAGDFNRDGISDIFQADFGIDSAPFPGGMNHLYLSNPSRHKLEDVSSSLVQSNQTNHALSLGDINRDGYLDVLINTLGGTGNALYVNDGSGKFVLCNDLIPHPQGAHGYQTNTSSGMADINGDGALDIIVGRWDSSSSTPSSLVWLNDGTGNFTRLPAINLPASPVALEIVLDVKSIDLNGDSFPDLMLSISNGGGSGDTYETDKAYYSSGYIQLLVNQNGKGFVDETAKRMPADFLKNVAGYGWFTGLTAVDFDSDGHQDILATAGGKGASSLVLSNRGDGTFFVSWRSTPDAQTVAADVNQDNRPDLVTHSNAVIYVDLNTLNRQQTITGSTFDDSMNGTNVSDMLLGGKGNDVIAGHSGNDIIDGGEGNDTTLFSSRLSNYSVQRVNGVTTVSAKSGAEDIDRLQNVETLQFKDMSINLGIQSQTAALAQSVVQSIVELYVAFFNRVPDADGLSYWIGQYQSGRTMNQIAEAFYSAGVQYSGLTGFSATMSNADFVNVVYKNVLGRPSGADAEGLAYWTGELASGRATHGTLVTTILTSAHTFKGNTTYGWVADLLDNKITVAKQFAVNWGLNFNNPDDSISHGMEIAHAVTPTDTGSAITLIGINPADISLG